MYNRRVHARGRVWAVDTCTLCMPHAHGGPPSSWKGRSKRPRTTLKPPLTARTAVRTTSSRALDTSRSRAPPGAGFISVAGCASRVAGGMHQQLFTRHWRCDRAVMQPCEHGENWRRGSTHHSSTTSRTKADEGFNGNASSSSKRLHVVLLARHSCRSVHRVMVCSAEKHAEALRMLCSRSALQGACVLTGCR